MLKLVSIQNKKIQNKKNEWSTLIPSMQLSGNFINVDDFVMIKNRTYKIIGKRCHKHNLQHVWCIEFVCVDELGNICMKDFYYDNSGKNYKKILKYMNVN